MCANTWLQTGLQKVCARASRLCCVLASHGCSDQLVCPLMLSAESVQRYLLTRLLDFVVAVLCTCAELALGYSERLSAHLWFLVLAGDFS
jgi:hypothetical protein